MWFSPCWFRAAGLGLLAVLCGGGCATNGPRWGDAPVEAVPVTASGGAAGLSGVAGWSGGVTAVGLVHPAVSHGSVELPAVSPNGEWVAYFEHAGGSPRPTAESLMTGRGLSGVSLWVRRVDESGGARAAVMEGACWPAWSGDSSSLFFVTYDGDRRCYLGRFDVATGRVERKALGLGHMLMPAANGDGTRVAVVGYAKLAEESRVFVVDWATTRAERAAAGSGGWQLQPWWVDAGTLLYVGHDPALRAGGGASARLLRWDVLSEGPPERVAVLEMEAGAVGAALGQQGVLRPFDLAIFSWLFCGADGAVRLRLLAEDTEVEVAGVAAAAWWKDRWLVVGARGSLELWEVKKPEGPGEPGAARAELRLLDGRWAPRWTDASEGSVIAVGLGDDPARLAVYQLWLVVAE